MRSLVRTEFGLVYACLAGLLVAYVGVALYVSGHHHVVGAALCALAAWLLVDAVVVHNRLHEENGERRHLFFHADPPR